MLWPSPILRAPYRRVLCKRSGAAYDRAEYSLQQRTIVIALLAGGVTLTSMGALRLLRRGLEAMPPRVAALSVVAGAGVLVLAGVFALADIDRPVGPGTPQTLPLEPHSTAEAEPPRGTASRLTGSVVTAEGNPVADVEVFLVPLFEEGQELNTLSGPAGDFEFADVELGPGTPYVAEASFDGARFPSAVIRSPSEPLRLVVALTTDSDEHLAVGLESVTVLGDDQGIQALHVMSISNLGDRAFTGPLVLPLLPGAAAVDPGMGLDRRSLDLAHGALVSTTPIPPGTRDITYTYLAPMQAGGITLERRTAYPTVRYELMVGGRVRLADVRGLDRGESVTLGAEGEEQTYEPWRARDLPVDSRVGARIQAAGGRGPLPLVLGALVLSLAVNFVLLPVIRRRRHQPQPDQEPHPAGRPPSP